MFEYANKAADYSLMRNLEVMWYLRFVDLRMYWFKFCDCIFRIFLASITFKIAREERVLFLGTHSNRQFFSGIHSIPTWFGDYSQFYEMSDTTNKYLESPQSTAQKSRIAFPCSKRFHYTTYSPVICRKITQKNQNKSIFTHT